MHIRGPVYFGTERSLIYGNCLRTHFAGKRESQQIHFQVYPLTCFFFFFFFFSDLCRHVVYAAPVQGFALEGHVIKNLSVGIHASCKHLCTMESHCLSFNLGPPTMGRMVCELSDSDVTKHFGDLKPRKHFVYRGTEVIYYSFGVQNFFH